MPQSSKFPSIGAVSYLNTKPLIHGLRDLLPSSTVHLDLPSRLADGLAAGNFDVALIPSVEFLRGSGLSILSDACIACHGPVRSVQLLFRCPPDQVRVLALDEGSRTSAALSQVLLYERFGIRPDLVDLPIDADFRNCEADAAVVIGDRAMKIIDDLPSGFVNTWDLGEEWCVQTGLPFVFAMWVAPTVVGSDSSSGFARREALIEALQAARNQGLSELDEIVRERASEYDLTEEDCHRYFTEQLYFFLGERELLGLELFRSQAAKIGLVPAVSCPATDHKRSAGLLDHSPSAKCPQSLS